MVDGVANGIVDAILAVHGEWSLFLGIVCRQVMWGGRFVVSVAIEPSLELL